MMSSPLTPFLTPHGTLVLDGGLATELERRGHDLSDKLWSARLLRDNPDVIKQVHLDYLYAGADCLITSTYQATIDGFMQAGCTAAQAELLIRRSVSLAVEARDEFWLREQDRVGRHRPIVAASVGPYGAYLADGSEYVGNYRLSVEELSAFHVFRLQLLLSSQLDLFAFETIPSFLEMQVLCKWLHEKTSTYGWFSFTCKDDSHISDGTPIAACAAELDAHPQVAAIGVNCVHPRHVPSLITAVQSATTKPIIVYANSGETWNPTTRQWEGARDAQAYGTAAREWRKMGAAVIGGCCRTTPKHIRAISERVRK